MAELTTHESVPTSGCCEPERRFTPREPQPDAPLGAERNGCGCSGGGEIPSTSGLREHVREHVRERYAAAARGIAETQRDSGAHSLGGSKQDRGGAKVVREAVFGGALYGGAEAQDAPADAIAASLGCGVPTAVADIKPGETVLDLGSGAGADVLIAARRVGAGGRAIGLDMTEEMLDLARANAAGQGVENAEFIRGYIEEIPLPDNSVDVVISNCVLNLSGDKPAVIREAARVLRPGGRFAISDVVADEDTDAATRAEMREWTGCIAGALTRAEFEAALTAAGLVDLEIRETHRVHEHAASAIIRARKEIAGGAAM